MRSSSSLRVVVASAVLASTVQLGCGPAPEGVETETQGVGSIEGMEGLEPAEWLEVADALEGLDETEAVDEADEDGVLPLQDRDGRRRRERICHFRGRRGHDRDRDRGVVLRVPRQTARRFLRRGDCRIENDRLRPGDRCDRDDCRDHDRDRDRDRDRRDDGDRDRDRDDRDRRDDGDRDDGGHR